MRERCANIFHHVRQRADALYIGYKYYCEAVNMPEECRYLRVRLQMEQQRFLNWGIEAGLLYDDGVLCATLQVNSMLLQDILFLIKSSMEKFAAVNGKYVKQLPMNQPNWEDEKEATTEIATMFDLPVQSLQPAPARFPSGAQSRGRNVLHRLGKAAVDGGRNLRDITFEPKRLVWATVDKEKLEKLVDKLTELNTFLSSLMDGSQIKRLQEAYAAGNRELLQLQNDVKSLQSLVRALSTSKTEGTEMQLSNALSYQNIGLKSTFLREKNYQEKEKQDLKRLAELKIQSTRIEQMSAYNVADASAGAPDLKLSYSSMTAIKQGGKQDESDGREGMIWRGSNVWIEWIPSSSSELLGPQNVDAHLEERLAMLAALLRDKKPPSFRAPPCLGYVTREDSEGDAEFGFVFKKPDEFGDSFARLDVKRLLKSRPKPSLSARVALAALVADCLSSFHSVNWLHKGLRSQNILLFQSQKGSPDFGKPYVSGFDLSRPMQHGQMTVKPQFDPAFDIYRHPNAQSSQTDGSYMKSYDIYSLGIILIEIAHWKPIGEILGIEDLTRTKPPALRTVRDTLLALAPSPNLETTARADGTPRKEGEVDYLGRLSAKAGDAYRDIVEICLTAASVEAPTYKGEPSSKIAVRLQHMYEEEVVRRLKSMTAAMAGN